MAPKKSAASAASGGSDREQALETVLAQIDKSYGKGSVMKLGERPVQKVEVIPTGSIALDVACLLYTSPSPRDRTRSRMPSSA